MIRIIRNSNQYHYLVNKYLLDSATEIEDLPTTSISPGSEAIINNSNTKYRLNNDFEWKLVQEGGGGGGAVESVNGKTGAVILTAADVGAASEDDSIWEAGEGLHSVVTKNNNNQAQGESAVAEGIGTDAKAKGSHTEGNQSMVVAGANFAHAEGNVTTAGGQASHAEGNNTVTNNQAEHAEGKFNKSNMGGTEATNTIHSVGIGKASGDIPGGERKNAFEIMENGDAYLVGVGNYDGTNPTNSRTVQEIISDIKTYQAMPEEWLSAGTFEEFVSLIENDASAVPGTAFLGTVYFDGMPPALGSAECIVDIISGDEWYKIALIKLNSSDIPPYNWEYNTWTGDFQWRELWSVPKAPTEDGVYKLRVHVVDGWGNMPEWEIDEMPRMPKEAGVYSLTVQVGDDGTIEGPAWSRETELFTELEE